MGVKVGDDEGEAVRLLHLARSNTHNPWALPQRPPYLGHVLEAKDLDLPDDEALEQLNVWQTKDGRGCALIYEGKVRALVIRSRHEAETGRGVKIGGSVAELETRYEERADRKDAEPHPGEKGQVHITRYNTLGIAFESEKGKITAITLYPRVAGR
jgi:hypothetical protein